MFGHPDPWVVHRRSANCASALVAPARSSFIDRQDVVGDDGRQFRFTYPPDEPAAHDAADQNVERMVARLLAVIEMLAHHHAVTHNLGDLRVREDFDGGPTYAAGHHMPLREIANRLAGCVFITARVSRAGFQA
jgi:hypothetical protein